MMSALFRSVFYTRMKRFWGENISICRMRKLLFTILRYFFLKQGISRQLGRGWIRVITKLPKTGKPQWPWLGTGISKEMGWIRFYGTKPPASIKVKRFRLSLVRFECENSAIDVIIIFLWKIFHKPNRTCGFEISTGQTKKFAGHGPSDHCIFQTLSSPGQNVNVRYCHYFATVICIC